MRSADAQLVQRLKGIGRFEMMPLEELANGQQGRPAANTLKVRAGHAFGLDG
jgi:hypothetical protein